MTPTYSVKPGGRRYRYYASPSTFRREVAKVSIARIPAAPLEAVIENAIKRLGLAGVRSEALKRVDIKRDSISIRIYHEAAITAWRSSEDRCLSDSDLPGLRTGALGIGETLTDGGDVLVHTLPVRAHFRGGRAGVFGLPQATSLDAPGPALLKALARSYRWKAWLMSGETSSVDALAARVARSAAMPAARCRWHFSARPSRRPS